MNNKLLAAKYIPTYQNDYHELEWYERDLRSYTDHFRYQDCVSDPDRYFDKVRVVNFT